MVSWVSRAPLLLCSSAQADCAAVALFSYSVHSIRGGNRKTSVQYEKYLIISANMEEKSCLLCFRRWLLFLWLAMIWLPPSYLVFKHSWGDLWGCISSSNMLVPFMQSMLSAAAVVLLRSSTYCSQWPWKHTSHLTAALSGKLFAQLLSCIWFLMLLPEKQSSFPQAGLIIAHNPSSAVSSSIAPPSGIHAQVGQLPLLEQKAPTALVSS